VSQPFADNLGLWQIAGSGGARNLSEEFIVDFEGEGFHDATRYYNNSPPEAAVAFGKVTISRGKIATVADRRYR
jgi:hypothetical protein